MNVQTLYRIFTGAENKVAGGEGLVGIYGSLTGASMQRIFSTLKTDCGFNERSVFLDIGAGLGRPLLHAAYVEHVSEVMGIEFDSIKCMKADAFAEQVGRVLQERNLIHMPPVIPTILCQSIEHVDTIEPATHVFSFWEGIPYDMRERVAMLCRESSTFRSIAVVQRSTPNPTEIMGNDFVLIDSFPVTMSGSGSKFVAYVFFMCP